MSAFVCDDNTFNALATYAVDKGLVTEDGRATAEMLKAENVRSVNYRYRENGDYEPVAFVRVELPPLALLKTVHCYDYQCCETDDWNDTESGKLCAEIERSILAGVHMTVGQATIQPTYERAPWGA